MRIISTLSCALYCIHVIWPCCSAAKSSAIAGATAANIKARRVLVVAGNFSIDGELVNIAQYDIATKEWSPKYESELYLYGESNGIIWDIVVNRTSQPFNKLFVVGAFDTVSETSQIQFCSVGEWDGLSFDKVGEGLCPRGGDSSTAMSIQTAALGNDGDIFVGGSFESRVWDGHHFVNVYHVAHFDGRKSSWLPLVGSQLASDNQQVMPRVNTLSWDAEGSVLYLGGSFYVIENSDITPGLAVWTEQSGLQPFPGGGLFRDALGVSGVALRIAYEPTSNALFVAGLFHMVNDLPCQNIAVWVKRTNEWICLYQSSKAFSTVTSMLVHNEKVYVTGWAAGDSDWSGRTWGSPYAIAVLDIGGFIQENQSPVGGGTGTGSGSQNSTQGNSTGYPPIYSPPVVNPPVTPVPYNTTNTNSNSNKDSNKDNSNNNSTSGNSSSSSGNSTDGSTEGHHSVFEDYMRRKKHSMSHRIESTGDTRILGMGAKGAMGGMNLTLSDIQERGIKDATSMGELLKIFHNSGGNIDITHAVSAAIGMDRRRRERNTHQAHQGGQEAREKEKHARRRRLRQESKKTAKITPPKPTRRRQLDYATRAPSHSPSGNSSGNNGGSGNGSTPTTAPVFIPWTPSWSWLPGYSGGNGPILRMQSGSESFEGCLFLVGAFNNYPAIALWYDDPSSGPYTVALPSKHSVQGFITAIVQVNLPFEDIPIPTPPPNSFHQKDYTLLILLSCVMVGVFLGVVFAICCHSQGYTKVDSDDNNGELMMSIPLKTLSGGANYSVDFRECFERAMAARHLPTHESLLIINPREIVLSKIIGEGSFGRVWNGQWRNNSVAVKEFVFAQAAIVGGSLERNNIIEEIVGEAGVMACLRHPKILQLYGCSLTMQAIWIVSEFCSRGSLRMLLNDASLDLPLLKRVSICLDVADGMLYLHTRSPPIIHRDIKSHNIFITEPSPGHFVAKIGDWGSARAVALTGAKSMTQGVGTACWLAPEVINFAHASKDSDVYAFGIVLWEVFTRHEVYEGLSAAQIIAKVANEGLRPRVPRDCPWASIMTECWQQDASQRPGFHRVMTSLSKIYSRAKAANKGKSGTTNAIPSPFGGKGDSPPAPVVNKSSMKAGSSIFQPMPSEKSEASPFSPTPRTGGITGALASFAGVKNNNNNNANKNGGGGVADIYFSNRNSGNSGQDQYLTVKPKMPSRVSSDPIRVYKQSDKDTEEHKGKAWSNDVLSKALKSWPSASDKVVNPAISSVPENEKTVRLYDFSSTPTGIASSSVTDGKKSPPRQQSRHSSGSDSPSRGSFLDKIGTKFEPSSSGGAPGGRRSFSSGTNTPGSGGSRNSTAESSRKYNMIGSYVSSTEPLDGEIDENPEIDKPPIAGGVFKAVVDLGEGRSSPIEYVVIEQQTEEPTHDKFADRSLDSSQNGSNESNEDDDAEGYGSIDKYNSMRVGRTASIASDVAGSKHSFSSVYESTRSESPPTANLFKSQQQTYTSGVSGGNSSNWPGPAYKKGVASPPTPPIPAPLKAISRRSSPPIEITAERNLFLKLPRSQVHSPSRTINARSPDLMAPENVTQAIRTRDGPLLVTPFYRSNASRSRSRSAGKWRAEQYLSADQDTPVKKESTTPPLKEIEGDGGDGDDTDELAGGYDTT